MRRIAIYDGKISIHPPRVGRDALRASWALAKAIFQSTLPVWGGTLLASITRREGKNFNPPSPCGEGPDDRRGQPVRQTHFNPPSPCGEGLCATCGRKGGRGISIHPPRVGRDHLSRHHTAQRRNFNPPSPCGEGRLATLLLDPAIIISIHPPRVGRDVAEAVARGIPPEFQSTLPVWGGTGGGTG